MNNFPSSTLNIVSISNHLKTEKMKKYIKTEANNSILKMIHLESMLFSSKTVSYPNRFWDTKVSNILLTLHKK